MNHRRYIAYSVRRTGCSGGNLPPSGVSRNRGTFRFVTSKPETPVIPTVAEWRNPPRWKKNHGRIKLAAWEDSSTPFHSTRNDMSGGGSVLSAQVVFGTWRAADCRPYVKIVLFSLVFDVAILRCVSKNCKNAVHYRRGGASRSESKSIDCRGQSHHNFIGRLPPLHPLRQR